MNRFRRFLGIAMALLAAVTFHDVALAGSSGLKKLFAQGQRFIDLLDTPAAASLLPSQGDLDQRFVSGGIAYGAQDVIILKDKALQGHITRVNSLITSLLAAYTEGPKPARVPFVIVNTNDVNCAVTPVAPEQYKNNLTKLAEEVFATSPAAIGTTLKTKAQASSQSRPPAAASFTGDELPGAVPVLMEMRCSKLFLDQVTSDDEMAFVIAHELSHILLGHWQAGDAEIRQQVGTEKALQTGLGLISAVQTMDASSRNTLSPSEVKKYDDARTKLTAATFVLNEYNIVIRNPDWKREQERDADILALDLLYKAKRTRAGSWDILTKGAAAQKSLERKNDYLDSLFKSASAQLVLGISTDRKGMLSTLGTTVVNFSAGVYGHFRDTQIKKVHDDAKDRVKAVVEYEGQHPVAEVKSQTEADFFGDNSFATVSAPISRASGFVASIQASGCETLSAETQKQLNAMVTAKARTQSESAALYTYYQCTDNDAKALIHAGEAANGPSKSGDYYTPYILGLIKAKQFKTANTMIAEATKLAPPYDQYVFLDIEVKQALGQKARALQIAHACHEAYKSTDGDIARHCMELVGLNNDGKPLEAAKETDDKPKGVMGTAASVAGKAKDTASGLVSGAKTLITGDKDGKAGKKKGS